MEDWLVIQSLAEIKQAEIAEQARHARQRQQARERQPAPAVAASAWYAPRWRALLGRFVLRRDPALTR